MKRSYGLKMRKFLEAYLQNQPLADCAAYAGIKGRDRHSLAVQGSQMLASLDLNMSEILDLHGVTDSYLAQKTREGLNAEKVEVATFRGTIGDERSYADYPTRAKYLEISSRLKGKFIDKVEISGREGGEILLNVVSRQPREKKKLELDL